MADLGMAKMFKGEYCLYEVQDDDRPMYIVAKTWTEALERWCEIIRIENELEPDEEIVPLGIRHVCDRDCLVLPEVLRKRGFIRV